MAATQTRYAVREFVGGAYSKQLGSKLRNRARAQRLVRVLRRCGRDAFIAPVQIAAEAA